MKLHYASLVIDIDTQFKKGMLSIQPIILEGKVVRLEPLSERHIEDLVIAGQDERIWEFMVYGTIQTYEQMRALVNDLLRRQAAGTDLPFAVIHKHVNHAIGMTRYLEIRPEHLSLEIGGTWYAPDYQRTAVNTESKYLLLSHAFETLGVNRVQFKTDLRNIRSQKAIERIGAIKEGVLCQHIILPDGRPRDSVYYSILREEWPSVKIRLEGFLNR